MAFKTVVEPMHFEAPIKDSKTLSLATLKEDARYQLDAYCRRHNITIAGQPTFRVEHGKKPVLHVTVLVRKRVRV